MYQVEVKRASGKSETHVLQSGQTTIGSDGDSSIVLTDEPGLFAKHILMVPQKEHCWVSTLESAPLRSAKGEVIQAAYVPWGTDLRLGACQFRLLNGEKINKTEKSSNPVRATTDTGGEGSKKISPMFIVIVICLLAVLGVGMLKPSVPSAQGAPVNPPELFGALPKCSSDNALHRARTAEESALAKSQRMVFDLKDGVDAADLFLESASCYETLGMSDESSRVSSEGMGLRQSLEEEYKLLRLRLTWAMQNAKLESAETQVRKLSALLYRHRDSSYAIGLRRLMVRLAKERREGRR